MRRKISIILLSVFIGGLCASCTSFSKLIPKKPRPFQKRSFDSKLWLEGDLQTRGEMMENLMWGDGNYTKPNPHEIRYKTRTEVMKILGSPDRKTRGSCCGAGGTSEGEVWLYDVEVIDGASQSSKIKQFQLYFTNNEKVDETRLAEWDDNNPDYFPRIG